MTETAFACLRGGGTGRTVDGMKWKLFVCGMVLIAAGCSTNNGPYAGLQEFGFNYDYSTPPIPGRTPMAMGQDYAAPLGATGTGAEITLDPSPYLIVSTTYP